MDPTKALADIRKCIARIRAADGADLPIPMDDVADLVESFDALDAWIKSGGFLPAAWSR